MQRPIVLALILALAAPTALALVDLPAGIGAAHISMGQGCVSEAQCYPEEYAWVAAEVCFSGPTTGAFLEAERLHVEAPPTLAPMPAVATGEPGCPYRAVGLVEFWTALVDPPLDCLRGSVFAASGVVQTRVACFSDL